MGKVKKKSWGLPRDHWGIVLGAASSQCIGQDGHHLLVFFGVGGKGSPEQEARAVDKRVAALGKGAHILVITMRDLGASLGKPVPLRNNSFS